MFYSCVLEEGSVLKKKRRNLVWETFVNNYSGQNGNCREVGNENLSDGKGGARSGLRLF